MVDLNDITMRLHHWLKKNDLPVEGVHLTLEFPDKDSACRAEMSIKREIEPMQAYIVTGRSFGKIETMNGLGLTLKYRDH